MSDKIKIPQSIEELIVLAVTQHSRNYRQQCMVILMHPDTYKLFAKEMMKKCERDIVTTGRIEKFMGRKIVRSEDIATNVIEVY